MPKILTKRKRPLSTAEKQERKNRWRVVSGLGWIDPYPWILGTRPEKMVYAFLMEIGIPFLYQTEVDTSIPSANFINWTRPDFVIPSLNIVIQVQGSYWHSSEEAQASDYDTALLLYLAGYETKLIWDWDLEARPVIEIFREYMPGVVDYRGPHVGEVITKHKEYIDDSKGVRKSLALRKDYFNSRARIKVRGSAKRKGVLSYDA